MDYFYSLGFDYQHSKRNVKVVHYGNGGKKYLIDYPFENGVRELPAREKVDCILGYVLARTKTKELHNLQEWIDNRLGFGIAKHFMLPYNKKIWNCELSDISVELVNSKIDPVTAVDFIKGALWKNTVGRQYQSVFIYLLKGIQEMVDYIARDIRNNICLNSNVENLSKNSNKWIVTAGNGVEKEFDMIISTIPLVELLKKINIAGIEKKYDELKWNNTFFVLAGLKKGSKFNPNNDCHWLFFKGNEVFYRVTLMHNFSDLFLPACVAEVTQKGGISGLTAEEIKSIVLRDLLRLGIIGSSGEIAQTDIKFVEHTYAIPTVGLGKIKTKISEVLKAQNMFLLGRNGNWDYINMDGVFLNVRDFINNKFAQLDQ
jgi:protoporphyrinogen oxidase